MSPILVMLLPILLPLILGPLSAFLLAQATGAVAWLRAHAHTKSQQAAIDLMSPLVLGQLQQVVKIAGSDLATAEGRTRVVGDVVANIKASAPQAIDTAKKLLGLGSDSFAWWLAALTHSNIAAPSPMTKTQPKTSAVVVAPSATMLQAERDADAAYAVGAK